MKVFYHSADLDGHCSGAIVKYKFPDCTTIGINYGQLFPWNMITNSDEDIFMVDFCLQPFEDMERLNTMCNLHWIDHHEKGSIDEAIKRNFLASGGQLLEIGRSGCELTWKYLINNADSSIPRAIFLLGRYDVWDHAADPHVLPFQYGMRQFTDTSPENQKLWKRLFEINKSCAYIVKDGKLLLDYETSQNTKFCRAYAFDTVLYFSEQGNSERFLFNAICANKGFTNSKLFDSAYDPTKHDLMITFVRLKPPAHKWTVSLYSTKDNVDCGAIAKTFGGGGHKSAAGFQCEVLPFSY